MWCFIPLWSHFVMLSSCLRDCNRHDDWLSCQNIIRILVNPVWSCPPDCTNFILFHAVIINLCIVTDVSPFFLFLFSTNTTLLYFSNYMTCINSVLLKFLLHIWSCTLYDNFVLLYVLLTYVLYAKCTHVFCIEVL